MDQRPVLPWEITDTIIDHLRHDVRALGNCGIVCSEWLIRSRYHIFSTVQLWPWRVRCFFNLATSKKCTFGNHINRIEVDDRRVRTREHSGKDFGNKSIRGGFRNVGEDVLFSDAMSQTDIPCLAQVTSMEVRNVDWTSFSPAQQVVLRGHLAKFHKLERLEFQGVSFHDLREVVRVVNSLPSLRHLTANITFTKYLEHAVSSAKTLSLSTSLRSVEVGTEDGIPVVLTCLSRDGPQHLVGLKLENIKHGHLQCIQNTLRKLGKHLRRLSLAFVNVDYDFIDALDVSHLNDLRVLRLEGLRISKTDMEQFLPEILQRLESPFLTSIEIKLGLECEVEAESVNWSRLERVLLGLHFFGLGTVRITGEVQAGLSLGDEWVERWICGGMADLCERKVLSVRMVNEKVEALCMDPKVTPR